MFANAKVIVFVASCALVAQAQTPSSSAPASTPTIPACVQGCLVQSVSPNTCPDFTNVSCVCTNQAFQAAVGVCLQNCTSADQAAAMQLQQQECSSLNGTTSSTASSAKGTATSASASASASATHSNAASAISAPLSLGGIFGTLVASAGALVGAAFVL